MQVIYKSSYEYDVESGTYKRVDKEVEQSSFDNDFTNALDAIEESGILQSEELQNRNFQNKTSQDNARGQENIQSVYANMSNIYAHRFKQEEFSSNLQQNKNESILSNLLNAI